MPTHGRTLTAIPVRRPAIWATKPMPHGIKIAPSPAVGSMMPMLAALVILPAQETIVGFSPAMESEKPSSNSSAGGWLLPAQTQSKAQRTPPP